MRDLVIEGGDDNQDLVPLSSSSREAVGHAVRATYLYAGVADLYAETGDQKRKVATLDAHSGKTWLRRRCTSRVGMRRSLHDGASPDGSKNQEVDHPSTSGLRAQLSTAEHYRP